MKEEEVMDYFRDNKEGVVLFYDSIDDYIVSRFLINRGFLREWLIFGSQAIEKMLKSFIFITKGKIPKKNVDKHNPFYLKEVLRKSSKFNLDKYDDLLKRLFGHYQSRYMDNKNQTTFKSSGELKEIDELYIFLLEKLPITEEIKYKSRFFQYLFSEWAQDNYSQSLKEHNDSLKNRLSEFKIKWKELK